ncbi:MAG: hypothetical protein NC913_07095 [Candidatus Omnitrophica bacterium]|nr:hypothetical protein [Candidatus Omnitrophota bacterium]
MIGTKIITDKCFYTDFIQKDTNNLWILNDCLKFSGYDNKSLKKEEARWDENTGRSLKVENNADYIEHIIQPNSLIMTLLPAVVGYNAISR